MGPWELPALVIVMLLITYLIMNFFKKNNFRSETDGNEQLLFEKSESQRNLVIRRMLALLIDFGLIMLIGWLLGKALFVQLSLLGKLGSLVGYTILILYFGIFNSRVSSGQTLGKRITDICVTGSNNEKIGIPKSLARAFILLMPFLANFAETDFILLNRIVGVLVWGVLFGEIYFLFVSKKWALHDLLCQTIVLRKSVVNQTVEHFEAKKAHFTTMAIVISVLIIFYGILIPQLESKERVSRFSSTEKQLEQLTNITESQITQDAVFDTKNGKKEVLYVQINVNRKPESYDKLAKICIKKILDLNPSLNDRLEMIISIQHGYDIGISSNWEGKCYEASITELRQWVEKGNYRGLKINTYYVY